MSRSSAERMAEALAQARAMGGQPGEPGLESPTGQRILENLGIAASGYGLGSMGGQLGAALAERAAPVVEGLGEAGAIFPQGTPPESLPEMTPGAKTGDPHALFAYHDDFGPDMSRRAIYNVFGDPEHPAVKAIGHGSSVTADMLEKYGIPIIGREAKRSFR